jgi:tetratricopeptide (TPR) repeat protein
MPRSALLAVALAAGLARAQGTYDLVLKEVEGDPFVTLRARDARIEEVLADLAQRAHKKLVGMEHTSASTPFSAELDERPLSQVLFTLAGCAGARARVDPTTIELLPDLGGGAGVEELEEQATVAWLRALQAHPTHALAARAELQLGAVQERHGHVRAAIGHYDLVPRNHPDSDLVPEALWRAGTLLARLDDHAGAAARFTALANAPMEHVHAASARRELARNLALSGDARQALLLLDALDNLYPTTERADRQARLFVRAIALRGLGQHGDALRALAQADSLGIDAEWELPATELRAQAFEHFERPADASRAWLRVAQLAGGQRRDRALIDAARLALAAGDPIAVLMIERQAAGTPAAAGIDAFAIEARGELGLATPAPASRLAVALERARGWLAAHLARQAVSTLEPAWIEREKLDDAELATLARLYAQALDEDGRLDAALDALRAAAREIRGETELGVLHATAGELYERHERFDEAARAYGGEL